MSLGAPLFRWACGLDVAVRKAGNVSWASPGHGMSAALFIESAAAAAGPLCRQGQAVGERIEAAVRASLGVAKCNTNLGILLLCAPLIAAAEPGQRNPPDAATLRDQAEQVLQGLDVADAEAVYRAIALAQPGGLGQAAEADVHSTPRIDLRAAMALAASRDQIAREYAEGFPTVFGLLLPAFSPLPGRAWSSRAAMLRAYLTVLAHQPDSHIVRKHGEALAHTVMNEARSWHALAEAGRLTDDDEAYSAWDTSLKQRAINPGTSADLVVATALVAALCLPEARAEALADAD